MGALSATWGPEYPRPLRPARSGVLARPLQQPRARRGDHKAHGGIHFELVPGRAAFALPHASSLTKRASVCRPRRAPHRGRGPDRGSAHRHPLRDRAVRQSCRTSCDWRSRIAAACPWARSHFREKWAISRSDRIPRRSVEIHWRARPPSGDRARSAAGPSLATRASAGRAHRGTARDPQATASVRCVGSASSSAGAQGERRDALRALQDEAVLVRLGPPDPSCCSCLRS